MSNSKNVCKELQLKLILNPPTDVSVTYVGANVCSRNGSRYGWEVQQCTCDRCLGDSNKWMTHIKFSGSIDYRKYMVDRDLANELRIKFWS